MKWAEQIRRYRFERGLTQEQLATEWGVDSRSIRRYEAGTTPPASWLKRIRSTVEKTQVSTLGLLDGYKMLVETNAHICTLYDANLILVSASKPALDFYMPTRTRPLIGIHLADGATPETLDCIAQLGGVRTILDNKTITTGTLRAHLPASEDEVGDAEFFVRQRFYIIRNDAGALVCVMLFTDRMSEREWQAVPPGLKLN